MPIVRATGEEAARRLERGEVVEFYGRSHKLICGLVHFETDIPNTWFQSDRFKTLRNVREFAKGWTVKVEQNIRDMLTKAVEDAGGKVVW